jgi:hypothetical protein
LREALRVARQAIVIENDVRGKVRGALTRLIDSWPAIRHGTPPCHFTRTREEWLKWFANFPVETRVLREFALEFGFFHNLTVILKKDERRRTDDVSPSDRSSRVGHPSSALRRPS